MKQIILMDKESIVHIINANNLDKVSIYNQYIDFAFNDYTISVLLDMDLQDAMKEIYNFFSGERQILTLPIKEL